MADPELPIPKINTRRRGWPSAVWIVPVLAIAAGVFLAVRTWIRKGPKIHVTFITADGLEAGKSEVRYKNVPVGRVTGVDLTEDRSHIIATIELTRGAKNLAVDDSVFWVERPRVGVGGVSGLGTLLSGAYIGVDSGKSSTEADDFTGLEKPPGVTHDQHGTKFKLSATDAGSLALRSPVYYRRVGVGAVTDYAITADGKHVDIEVFIDSPYDHFVTDQSVFWNASGMDVAIDANGLRLDTQSLATVVAGGIAFAERDPSKPGKPNPVGVTFPLYDNHPLALAPPDNEHFTAKMRFWGETRNVVAGTIVDLEGVQLGRVDSIDPGYDRAQHEFYFDVTASVYPSRLGAAYPALQDTSATGLAALQRLVTLGLRAQIRSASFLTGQAYVALAWFPKAKPVPPVDDPTAWVIPTQRAALDQIEDQVQRVVAMISKIPFDAIGEDVRGTAHAASALLGRLDRDVVPEAKEMLAKASVAMGVLKEGIASLRDNVAAPDSGIQQATRGALEQIERAASSLRSLSDYIEHHPETLIRGRKSE